jgi:acylglycerol lipase
MSIKAIIRHFTICLPLLLAACAGGPIGEPAPLGQAHVTETSINGGAELHLSHWMPETPPRAILLALHGFGDHGRSTFEKAAQFWAAQGIAVYAYDHRGFGHNASRGEWPGAERLIADFQDVAAALRAAHPDTPLFALGHSMGGGIALAGAAGAPIDGLILAAPAVWGGDNLGLHYRAAAWAGAVVAPEKRWSGEGIVSIQASDNIEALRAMGRDPLVFGRPSSREFMGLIRLMDRAVAAAPTTKTPVLFLYGQNDQVTPKQPMEATFAALPGPKTFKLYPAGWHLLFRDLQAEAVWSDVTAWIAKLSREQS